MTPAALDWLVMRGLSVSVVVTGGRLYQGRDVVWGTLDTLHGAVGVSLLAHGGASGADSLADAWARDRDVPVEVYRADWRKHGRAAGPRRNAMMMDLVAPDVVVAFPGGRGTAHAVYAARRRSIFVLEAP